MASSTKPRQEDLMSYFERSATTVRSSFDRFEHTYVRPKLLHLRDAFQRRPVRVTFLCTFAALAFLPVLSFLGFSLFFLAGFTLFALGCALVASTLAILTFASILAFTLFTLFGIAIILTSSIISFFLFARFVLHVRSEGPRSGILQWGKETKSRIYGPQPQLAVVSPHVQSNPDTIDDAQVKHEPEDGDSGFTTSRNPAKSPSLKHKGHRHRKGSHYPLSNTSPQDAPIKAGGSPGLSSNSSSNSSSESEHEDTNSTLGTTVVIEGLESSALGPTGLGIANGGELKGEALVEGSPIIVKTNGDYPDKYD